MTFASILIVELYVGVGSLFPELWQAAAIVNSALSLTVILFFVIRRRAVFLTPLLRTWKAWIIWTSPSAMVLLLSLLAILGSSLIFPPGKPSELSPYQWAFILWIPVVEEITFRGGLGSLCRNWIGDAKGAYVEALGFSFVHSLPTITNISQGQFGLAAGPFFLALIVEYMFIRTGSLLPGIIFHGACNATAAIFIRWDVRWLEYLEFLYV